MDWHESGLSVGELARRMDLAPSAIRWYDEHGLLPSERTTANHRRFFADACCRIAMIRASQRAGLSVAEIRQALESLTPGEAPTTRDWERLAERLREVLGPRVEELNWLLQELESKPPG